MHHPPYTLHYLNMHLPPHTSHPATYNLHHFPQTSHYLSLSPTSPRKLQLAPRALQPHAKTHPVTLPSEKVTPLQKRGTTCFLNKFLPLIQILSSHQAFYYFNHSRLKPCTPHSAPRTLHPISHIRTNYPTTSSLTQNPPRHTPVGF